jgi:predicted Zn-dependent protease
MHGHLAAIADMTTARPLRPSKLPRWRAGLLAALLALSGPLAPPVAAQSLPALGDGVEVSMASERRLGDRIATGIYRDPAWLDDAVLGDYLQAIWQPLVQAALREPLRRRVMPTRRAQSVPATGNALS